MHNLNIADSFGFEVQSLTLALIDGQNNMEEKRQIFYKERLPRPLMTANSATGNNETRYSEQYSSMEWTAVQTEEELQLFRCTLIGRDFVSRFNVSTLKR